MIWLVCALSALALVVLFFPFVFWIDFKWGMSGATARIRLFKKNLWTYKKVFEKKESPSMDSTEDLPPEPQKVATAAAPERQNQNSPKKESPELPPAEEKPKVNQPEAEKSKAREWAENESPAAEPAEKESSSPESKRSLTDSEFWTLLLTPDFDKTAFWAVKKWLGGLFKLFKIRFRDCFVEGIRTDYLHMGYMAALNGFLKSYPYIGAWDFRMDWTYDHELKAEGRIQMSVNFCRLAGLLIETLFYGGIVAYSFWKRRRHILKTNELPELGFIRKKIVKLMAEE